MKTNKKFPFLKCFSQEEIKRFPNGWITKSEIARHVLQDISSNDDDDNLISKIILIKPNIWGQDFMNHKYWKEHMYHPSLTNKDKNTMNTEIFLIGKVIKGTKKEKANRRSRPTGSSKAGARSEGGLMLALAAAAGRTA